MIADLVRIAPLLLIAAATAEAAAMAAECPLQLVDRLGSSGIDFRHISGRSAAKHLPETMGAGAAWLDYDGDGWEDLYLVQSGRFPPTGGEEATNHLFRNLGGGRFADVTEATGAGDRGYGQGVLAGDVDGDGDPDLWVGNYGPDTLLLNEGSADGGRRFRAVALPDPDAAIGWSSSAAFADADRDGDLDLYVTRYLVYDPGHDLFCGTEARSGTPERREYCDPSLFLGQRDRFFRNDGGGQYTDVTERAGLGSANGKGLGVVFVDLDGDRRPDLYVANDITLNLMFRNRSATPGEPRFEDVTLLSGAAVNLEGKPEAGMGVAAGDFDEDGDPDLAVTNFDVETNTLYRNLGDLVFEDVSAYTGFGLVSFNSLGFGVALVDFDLDGHLDVYIANGHIFEQPKRENTTYRQRDLFLRGRGDGTFEALACALAEVPAAVGRAVAVADYDRDGDPDLVVTNNDAAPFLLENRGAEGAALAVELRGTAPNTGAIGARVTFTAGSQSQARWLVAGDSYQASSSRVQLFGRAAGRERQGALDFVWPSGRRLRLVVPAGREWLRRLRIVEPATR